ncbi:chemotaxis protein CheA [Helicovermis profundi]|uniref:Chemotaxis protein CheA n=2 Tax=Helicovermis profundi TaxID=3065157 RepID=A0AAU9E5L1_9FIRM|nr:chemotaxis protein CheA [Clostridia bacterium S502]
MDMSQYMEIFIEESKEHLQHMNGILLELEDEPNNLVHLKEIFRIAHTIKGMSGTMGFTKVADITHEMENVLDLVRNSEIKVTTYIIDVLFECFDTLDGYIVNLENTGEEGDIDSSELVAKLRYLVKNKVAPTEGDVVLEEEKNEETSEKKVAIDNEGFVIELDGTHKTVIKEAIRTGNNVFKIKVVVEDSCLLRAARAFIVFNTLEQFGEVIESYPIAEEIEDEKFDKFFEVVYITKLDEKTIKNELMNISEIENVIVAFVELEDEPTETVIEIPKEEKIDETKSVEKLTKKSNKKANKKTDKKVKPKTAKTVRVDIDRLDNLMNLVSELIIIKTRLEDQDSIESKANMNEAIEYLERITTSLHDAVMKVRMVPVERTFNRFPRMVRDLSKDLGKGIKLVMSGEETEVDRTVIDEIGDPLIHLIRNSIDHGIESPEERVAKNKPEMGIVALRAYPDGNTVVIEVEDDGNGIDAEKVAGKAVSKGLLTEAEVENMSEKELVNLLFLPGLSTAEVVTDLSGRGVGLDVVKSKIELLNGTVEVKTVLGKGSKFTIRLPLTLAIIQALMVNLAKEKYAIPLNNIKEITTINASTISMVQNQEVVLYRNNTLPLLRLDEILNVEKENEENREELIVVIVRKGESEAGFVVDSLIGQQEIVIKSLGKYINTSNKGAKSIAGATILGNGGVALIVDPNQLF